MTLNQNGVPEFQRVIKGARLVHKTEKEHDTVEEADDESFDDYALHLCPATLHPDHWEANAKVQFTNQFTKFKNEKLLFNHGGEQ